MIFVAPIELLGYEARVVRRLPESSRRQIEWLAEGYLLSTFMLSAPIAYAVWLIQHSLLAAFLSAAFAWCLILAVLRLLVAGGGAAPHMNDNEVKAHSPSSTPMLMWFSLAVMFAQIAQLPVFQSELNVRVNAHRVELMAQHDAARDLVGTEIHPEYGGEIARCEFLMFRLQQLWQRPGRTLVLTAVYVALVISPFMFAFLFARRSLREYGFARTVNMRRVIVHNRHQAEVERQRLLRPFNAAAVSTHYVDAPFNRRVRAPLLMPLARATRSVSNAANGRKARQPR